jgi:hypothetical protein
VSRRFVALTQAQLTTWLSQPLDTLDVRVILIDGIHFRDHVILLALGIVVSHDLSPLQPIFSHEHSPLGA